MMKSTGSKKRWARRVLFLCLLLLCMAVALVVALQTTPAKRVIAALLSDVVTNNTKYSLHIDSLSGTLPHDIRIATITIGDPRGDLITLHDLEVRISMSSLLRGRIHVQTLTLAHLEIWNRPLPRERWRIPRMPGLPVWPTVDLLRVDRITLDEAVLGAPATLSLTGRLQPIAGSLLPEIELEAHGLDAEGIHGTLRHAFENGAPRLSLAMEDAQLLPVLLAVTPPVKINLEGKGQRADWNATLNAVTGDAPLADGQFHLAEGETTSVQAAMHIHTGILPMMHEYSGMIGDAVTVNATGSLDRQGVLHIDPLSVLSETASLTLQGKVNLDQDSVDLSLAANYDNVTRLPLSLSPELVLPLQVEAQLQGAFVAPEIKVAALLGGTTVIEGAIDLELDTLVSAMGNLHITPPVLLQDMFPVTPDDRVAVTFAGSYSEDTGSVEVATLELLGAGIEASLQGSMIPALPTLDMRLSCAAADLSRFNVFSPIPLSGSMTVGVNAKGTDTHLETVITAAMETVGIGTVQAGSGQLDGSVQWDNWLSTAPENISGKIKATTTGLHISPLKAMDLVLDTSFNGKNIQEIQVASLSLTDGNVVVAGDGMLNIPAMTGSATLETTVPHLAALPLAMEKLPDGTLQVQSQFEGGIAPLLLQATVAGKMNGITGVPDAVAVLAGKEVVFDTGVVIEKTQVTLQDTHLKGDGFALDGEGVFDWTEGRLESNFNGALPDLHLVSDAVGKPLSGAITMTVLTEGMLPHLAVQAQVKGNALTYGIGPPVQTLLEVTVKNLPEKTQAAVTCHAQGGDTSISLFTCVAFRDGVVVAKPVSLVSGDNRIEGRVSWPLQSGFPEAQMIATLDDLGALAALAGVDVSGRVLATANLQQEKAELDATLEGMRYGNLLLEKATVWGAGDKNNFIATTAIKGTFFVGSTPPQTFSFASKNRVSVAQQTAALERFEGVLGAFPFSLQSKGQGVVTANGFYLEPLALNISDGIIRADLRSESENLQGKIEFDSVPLALSGLFVEPAITGLLDGVVSLSGTLAQPAITTTFEVSKAQLALETAEAFAPLNAEMDMQLKQGRFDATVAAAMDNALTIKGQGSVPLMLQLQPLKLEFRPDMPISGNLSYTILSAPILQALGVIEHQLEAELKGKFDVTGTVNAPAVSGDAHVHNGRYANTLAGTQLHNLKVHVAATGASLQLRECTADDGKDGTVSVIGEMQLLPAQHFPFTLQAAFHDAELAHLDYLTGRVSGALDITGGLEGIAVGGDLVIGPVQASMPDQMPVSEPTVLDVIEIADGEIVTPEKATSGGALPKVELDIRCDIPGRVYVCAPVLDSEWGGKLHVGGTLTAPDLEGRVSVLRGHLDFLGRRFQLRDSAFSFPGGPPTDLWLDMRAVSQTQSLSSQLRLTGKLSEVKLELSSEPPLPQDEVLAQVLFGRDLSRISPVQAIQLARVAAMFNKGLAGMQFFSGTVGLPGIDRIDIRTGEKADETVVGLGKYLTDSVYVEVEQGTTTDSGKISVEVEVTPNVSVKGDVDAKERSGVGLFWNKDY